MLEKADEILVGVSILMKAAKVTKGYIGIENNKPDAIKLMTEKAAAYPGIEVVPLKVKYPQGGEKQLIERRYRSSGSGSSCNSYQCRCRCTERGNSICRL